jgi:hypothetical protein
VTDFEADPGNAGVVALANDYVVDAGTLEHVLYAVQVQPDLLNCLAFGALAEALVLHDRLIVVGEMEADLDPSIAQQTLIAQMLGDWIASGIVVRRPSKGTNDSLRDPFEVVRQSVIDSHPNAVRLDENDNPIAQLMGQAGRTLDAERHLGRPGFTPPLQQLYYESFANVRADNTVCSLSGHYSTLARTLSELRSGARIMPTEYVAVPLPPIAYRVLAMSRSLDDLLVSTLNIREEFRTLRDSLVTLQTMLDDPTVALSDKLRHKALWETRWARLHARYDRLGEANLAVTNSALYELAPEIPGAIGLEPRAWIRLLTAVADAAPELWSRWRLRALHRSATAYLRAPDAELAKAIGAIRGTEVTAAEATEVHMLLAETARSFARLVTF